MAVGKSADGPIATTHGAKGQRSQAELERIAAGVVVSGVSLDFHTSRHPSLFATVPTCWSPSVRDWLLG